MLCWLLGISVLEQAVRYRIIEIYRPEKVADPVFLSRWASCGSSDARRFRFDYLFIFLVLIEHLFFRIEDSSLRWLACLCVLTHSLQCCIADSSSAYSLSNNGPSFRTFLSS